MRKIAFTFLVLLIIASIGYPQSIKNDSTKMDWEWAPVGAVWMYATTGSGYYWYVHSEKDTVFKGKECRKLKVERYHESSSTILDINYRYTYNENGKVYLYSFAEDEFQAIYNYHAQEGDTIRLYSPLASNDCYVDYFVDSVIERLPGVWPNTYPVFETNTTIKSFHLNIINSMGCGEFHGASNIGDYLSFSGATNSDMCPVFVGFIPEEQETFNCYYDGNVNIFRSRNDSCIAYYQEHLNISQNNMNAKINLYPNPVDNELHIGINDKSAAEVSIYNASGILAYKKNIESDKCTIDFTGYPAGLYIVTINNNDQLFRKKIIKTK